MQRHGDEAPHILIVDDNHEALLALEDLLVSKRYKVSKAFTGKEAIESLEQNLPDLVLLDVNMPDMDGFEVTHKLKSHSLFRFIPVVLLTAKDELDDITHGLSQGADDYIKKPYKAEELLARVNAALRVRKIYRELKQSLDLNAELQVKLADNYGNIIGKSGAIKKVVNLIEKVKDADVPVLITGESGTGKELVAAALHYQSIRKDRPFIVQNCAAFHDNLLESELFGHIRGSFTGAIRDKEGLFELAHGGTLFLDEVGELGIQVQAKLLRVLQDGSFTPLGGDHVKKCSVRVLTATNRDLKKMRDKNEFREDLFYRLNVINIELPSLRERRVDIPILVDHFLESIAKRTQKPKKNFTAEALLTLSNYNWPGNIRELLNEIEKVVLLSSTEGSISTEFISAHIRSMGEEIATIAKSSQKLKDTLENVERKIIQETLVRVGGNKSEAARELGISRSNLVSKVQLYGLE